MDISTTNVIIGVTLTFIGSAILVCVGIVISYVRSINKNTKETYGKVIEHATKIDGHEKRLDNHEDMIFQLQKRA